MGSIKNVVSEPIEGHEDYHMMVSSLERPAGPHCSSRDCVTKETLEETPSKAPSFLLELALDLVLVLSTPVHPHPRFSSSLRGYVGCLCSLLL